MEHVQSGRMTVDEYGLYTALILLADHHSGSWTGSAAQVSKTVHWRRTHTAQVIDSLIAKGYLKGRRKRGTKYELHIEKYFNEPQKNAPKGAYKPKKYAPNGAYQTTEREHTFDSYLYSQELKPLQEAPLASLAAPVSEKTGFASFWQVYPRKVGKFTARKVWEKLHLEEHTLEVVTSVEAWSKTEQWQEVKFVPHPATFLNQRRWQDEIPAPDETKDERRIRETFESTKRVAEKWGIRIDDSPVARPARRLLQN